MITRLPKIFKLSSIPAIKSLLISKTWSLIQFILLIFFSFILIVNWMPIASGKIPLFNINQIRNEKNIIDIFNQPRPCGNFVCSAIWFNGLPIFEIASYPINQQDKDQPLPVEDRARRIQNNLKQILQVTITDNSNLETQVSENPAIKQNKKDTHPKIPIIEVSTLYGETVIVFPQQFDSPKKIIATVTIADALYYSKTIEQLAQEWQNIIISKISSALEERYFNARNRFVKPTIIIALMVVMLLLSFAVILVQIRCQNYYTSIRNKLQVIEKSLTINPECAKPEELTVIFSQLNLEVNQNEKYNISNYRAFKNRGKNRVLNSAIGNQILLYIQLKLLWQTIPKIFLRQQNILKQELNIVIFARRLLRWVQGLILGWGIGLILIVYPQTRAIGTLLIYESVGILIVWAFISLADKVTDFVIDFYLHKWAENAQLANPNSGRYTLRVSTYSAALTSMTSIIFWIIGIIVTAEKLGIATQVLTNVGIIAAVSAYLSQNLIRDVINGAFILWNDSYAVGDVVTIGAEGGLVEKMNLYMTALRSADGELIIIPNGSIGTVKNLTKNWSRVNFTIQIAYDADIKKAMQIIQEVAEKMASEVKWRDNFIEPPEVLGVEEVSHSGILIRVWIKTPPLQQWIVGREFRLRVKEAFDSEGIAIGVPQRSLSVNHFPKMIEKQNTQTDSSS